MALAFEQTSSQLERFFLTERPNLVDYAAAFHLRCVLGYSARVFVVGSPCLHEREHRLLPATVIPAFLCERGSYGQAVAQSLQPSRWLRGARLENRIDLFLTYF